MYEESIELIERPDEDDISLVLGVEDDAIFALGERMYARFPNAYMNGYNWDALIHFYVGTVEPQLADEVKTDPEAGRFVAYMSYSDENLAKMKRLEGHLRALLADESALMAFIEEHDDAIGWD